MAYHEQRYLQYHEENWRILADGDNYYLGHIPFGVTGVSREEANLVEISLSEWPLRFQVDARRWDRALETNGQDLIPGASPGLVKALQATFAELRNAYSSSEQLLSAISDQPEQDPLAHKSRIFMENVWYQLPGFVEDTLQYTPNLGHASFGFSCKRKTLLEIFAFLVAPLNIRLRSGLNGFSVATGKAIANAIERAIRLSDIFSDEEARDIVNRSILYALVYKPDAPVSEKVNQRMIGELLCHSFGSVGGLLDPTESCSYAKPEIAVALAPAIAQIFSDMILFWRGESAPVWPPKGNQALFRCLVDERLDLLAIELAKGEDPDRLADFETRLINADLTQESSSLVHVAMTMGNTEALELLIRHGANLNSSRADGLTPLHRAVMNGQTDLSAWLIDHGANFTCGDCYGNSPLHYAGKPELLELFIRKGVNPDIRAFSTGYTPLHTASLTGNLVKFVFLLRHGADANAKANLGQTPLHMLATCQLTASSVSMADALFKAQIDLNATDEKGNTPLHWAAGGTIDENVFKRSSPEMIDWLLTKGANPKCRNSEGLTAADVAWSKGDKEAQQVFTKHKIKPGMKYRFR